MSIEMKKYFNADISTYTFVFYNIFTLGIYSICWLARSIEVLDVRYNAHEKSIQKSKKYLWAYVVVYYFMPSFLSIYISGKIEVTDGILIIIGIFILFFYALTIIYFILFAYYFRFALLSALQRQNIVRPINLFFAVILSSVYFYYIIHNIDEQVIEK